MNRKNCILLHKAIEIHAVLTALQVGDVVPPEIYIRDHNQAKVRFEIAVQTEMLLRK